MSSSVDFVTEQGRCGDDGNGAGETVKNGEIDHLLSEPSAPTISLPTESFLRAATLLKNQVRYDNYATPQTANVSLVRTFAHICFLVDVCIGCGGHVERWCRSSCLWFGSSAGSDCVHRTTRHSVHLLEVVRGNAEPSRSANLRRDNRHVCQRCACHNQVKKTASLSCLAT